VGLEDRLEDVEPGDVRHVEIHEHDVELPPPHRLDRLFTAADRGDVVAVRLKDGGAALPERTLVVDDGDADAGLDLGRDGQGVAGRFGYLDHAGHVVSDCPGSLDLPERRCGVPQAAH